ncbi:MAG TPA: threonine synthase [Steroidobacteraceae bacterium]|nr:threonine synthase [Steroidobacteraceae bacterium]
MQYVSTRDSGHAVGLSAALARGLAADGGLYVPERFPLARAADFDGAATLRAVAPRLLQPFFAGDALEPALPSIVTEAFDFPVPLVPLPLAEDAAVLELFHGPTAAFKDFGARFLAGCFARLPHDPARPRTILVATSGDTGGAVAAAFHGRPGAEVVVLYPKGLVSPRQEQQLSCWGGNVRTFAVLGTFDDCQALVKAAFADNELRARRTLTSANSINVGRLLPQAGYYAYASLLTWRRTGQPASFIVPSGNLGNVLAAVWARRIGLPIGELVLAFNDNRTVPDYLATGEWWPRPSRATLASAMDVGNPSNMERLRHLYPEWHELVQAVSGVSVSDEEIRRRIRIDHARLGQVWCPHTATAAEAYARLDARARAAGPWVLVATAHPAKFPETVEPLIGESVPVPPALARLLALPRQVGDIPASLEALKAALP